MKKNMRMMLSLLLTLVLVFQLAGGLALADDVDVTLTGKESLVYELRIPDPEDPSKTIPVSAEEEAEKLGGKTCSVAIGKADAAASDPDNTAMSRSAGGTVLEDLLKKNLFIAPPEGYFVKSAYIRGDAVETQEYKTLPFTANAESTLLTLKAGAVEEAENKFDKGYITTASTVNPPVYTLVIVLAPLDKEKNITVTEALDKDASGAESSLAPGSAYTAPIAPADTETHKFAGWRLSYKNGGSLKLDPGQSAKPYADCRVEAQWTEIITISANAPVQDGDSMVSNGWTFTGKLDSGDVIDSVTLNVEEQAEGFVAVPSGAVILRSGKNVTDRYELRYENSVPVQKDDGPAPGGDDDTPPAPKEPVKLTITANEPVTRDGGKTYEQNSAVLSAGALNEGDSFASIVIDVQQNANGNYVAIPRDAVIKNGEIDHTADYEITYLPSAEVVPPAPEKVKLTVTAKEPVTKDGGKTYEHDGAILSAGTLNEGDAFTSIAFDVKQNEDGSYISTPRDAVIKNGDIDNTANYEITYESSKPVTPPTQKIPLTIRSKDRSAEYTGKLITADAYELVSGSLTEGHSIEVTYEGGSTNVTASPVASPIASVVVKDALGQDVTDLYEITLDNENAGKVTVTKRSITVTAITGTVVTDGTKVIYAKDCKTESGSFNHGHKVEGLLEGHALRGDFVKGYGSETFTTSIDLSALRIVDTANVETDVTANYDIKTVDGKMTIKVSASTGVPVAVTVKDQAWTYDGTARKPDQTGYNISGLLDGDVATVTLKVKQGETESETATNAGTYTIVPVISIRSKDGAAVADGKYKINAGTGTLTVKKLDITLEAVSDSKYYDGKALVNDKVKAPALAAGHKYSGVKLNVYDAKGNLIRNGVKEVGTYTKKITEVHILDSQGAEVTDNYNITKIDGKLTILPSDKNDSNKVKTGDDSHAGFFIVVIVVCLLLLAAIAALLILQRRKARAARMPEDDYEYYEDDGDQNQR